MTSTTCYVGIGELVSGRGRAGSVSADSVHSIPNAAILVRGDRIEHVGTEAAVRPQCPADTVFVDMQGKTAVPGFIDPHTHLVWGGDRSAEFNRRLHGATYVDIAAGGGGIKSTVAATRQASKDQLAAKARKTLDTMLLHGVTTIEAKSGYGLSRDAELKQLDVMDQLSAEHPIDMVQTFMGAHEIPPEYAGRADAYIDMLNQELLPEIKQRGTVRYVDIFCEKNVFELDLSRKHLQAALDLGFKIRLHADELFPLGGAGLAAELGAVSADHLVHATREHMQAMAESGTIATLLPGTSFFLRAAYADAAAFQEAGCTIALSTDYNPGSSHTISQAVMMALGCMKMGMTFEQAFLAVTLNAAAAIEKADQLGSLEAGKQADILFLDAPSAMYLVYYWGVNHVSDVVKAGRRVVQARRRIAD